MSARTDPMRSLTLSDVLEFFTMRAFTWVCSSLASCILYSFSRLMISSSLLKAASFIALRSGAASSWRQRKWKAIDSFYLNASVSEMPPVSCENCHYICDRYVSDIKALYTAEWLFSLSESHEFHRTVPRIKNLKKFVFVLYSITSMFTNTNSSFRLWFILLSRYYLDQNQYLVSFHGVSQTPF